MPARGRRGRRGRYPHVPVARVRPRGGARTGGGQHRAPRRSVPRIPLPSVSRATSSSLRQQWSRYRQVGTPARARAITESQQPTDGEWGGGGYATSPAELAQLSTIKFKEGDFDIQGGFAPEWWHPFIPENAEDMRRPDVAFLTMLNASIPYLGPEDQRNAAAQLYALHGNAFASYKPEEQGETTQVITEQTARLSMDYRKNPEKYTVIDRDYFQSKARAEGFINLLSQMREQAVPSGQRDQIGGTGIPYTWLQSVVGTLSQHGGEAGDRMTRADYLSMIGALDPLLAQGKSPEVGAALSIGRMFAQPFFSAGSVGWPSKRFGSPNPLLMG